MNDNMGHLNFSTIPHFVRTGNSTTSTPILLVRVLPVVVRLSSHLTFLIIPAFTGWVRAVAIRVGISSLLSVKENGETSKKKNPARIADQRGRSPADRN